MIIHDQHVHSYYSFDSEQTIKEYLKKAKELGLKYFVLTDHCDLNYLEKGEDLFFDIDKRNAELDKLQVEFKEIKILKGIEVGYKPKEIARINKIISENNFDIINFSLHESEKLDYYYVDEFIKNGVKKTLIDYFEKELEAVTTFKNYDVFCHIDYGFKTAYLASNKKLSIEEFENEISKIMKVIIKDKKALEINEKVQSFLTTKHTKYILNLYKKLGGKYLTISSDAHEVSFFRYDFDKYINIIKEAGFKYLTYFVARKRKLLKL